MANLVRVRDLLMFVRNKLKENHKDLYNKMDYVGTTIWDTENYVLWDYDYTSFICSVNPYGSEGVYVDVSMLIREVIPKPVSLFSAKTLYEGVEGYRIAGEAAGLINFYADKFLSEHSTRTVSLSMANKVDSYRDEFDIFELKDAIGKMENGEIKEFYQIKNISYLKQLHNHYFIGEGVKRCAQLCSEPANAEYIRFFLRDIPDNDGLLAENTKHECEDYSPNNEVYPLCNGNGTEKCHDCCVYEDFEQYHSPYAEE